MCRTTSITGAIVFLLVPLADFRPMYGQGLLEQLERQVRQRLPVPSGRLTLGLEAEERGAAAPFEVVVHSVRVVTPAAEAGIQPGDVIVRIDGAPVDSIEAIANAVRAKRPGDELRLGIQRGGAPLELVARFPASTPLVAPPDEALPGDALPGDVLPGDAPAIVIERPRAGAGRLGVTVENAATTRPGPGVPVQRGAVVVAVSADSPAAAIGVQPGNVIVSVDGVVIQEAAGLIDQISKTVPGQSIEIGYYRGAELVRTELRLAGPPGTTLPGGQVAGPVNPPLATPGTTGAGGVLGGLGNALGGIFGGAAGGDSAASPTQPRPAAPAMPPEPLTPPEPGRPPEDLPTPRTDGAEIQQLKAEVESLRRHIETLERRLQELESSGSEQEDAEEPVQEDAAEGEAPG